jgi:YesN/AraC family two-component response regulator
MQVLIVDDNVMDRKYIKNLLENKLNIEAKTAKNGVEALEKIKISDFDLIITDIVMPVIDGFELIKQAKQLSLKTKIIAMSGNNPYYLYIINRLGIDNIFTKPIDTERFLGSVSSLLQIQNKSACA